MNSNKINGKKLISGIMLIAMVLEKIRMLLEIKKYLNVAIIKNIQNISCQESQ
jgi:hypothetical protein